MPHAFSSTPPDSLEFSIRSDPIGFTATIRNGYTIEHILLLLQLRMYIQCTTWTAYCDVHVAGGGGTDKLCGSKFVWTAQPMASLDNSARISYRPDDGIGRDGIVAYI